MPASYAKNSPYANTPIKSFYLDILKYRKIEAFSDDPEYQISDVYQYRPDLLASDLYGDSGLWWIFSVRNPDLIEDPVYDFVTGLIIKIPKISAIKTSLGI